MKRKTSSSPSRAPARKQLKLSGHPTGRDPRFTGELSSVRRNYIIHSKSDSPDFKIQVQDLKGSLLDTLKNVFVAFLMFWTQLKLQVTFIKEGEACSFWFVLPKHYFRQEQDLVEIVDKMLEVRPYLFQISLRVFQVVTNLVNVRTLTFLHENNCTLYKRRIP
jgi:hypothetical protein